MEESDAAFFRRLGFTSTPRKEQIAWAINNIEMSEARETRLAKGLQDWPRFSAELGTSFVQLMAAERAKEAERAVIEKRVG